MTGKDHNLQFSASFMWLTDDSRDSKLDYSNFKWLFAVQQVMEFKVQARPMARIMCGFKIEVQLEKNVTN